MSISWRLIDTDIVDGPKSAAIDEAILEAKIRGLVPNTVHLYRRSPPAVSISYFQSLSEVVDVDFCRENGIDIVRRLSGGGAIYTDENCLEYAVVVEQRYILIPSDLQKSFEVICNGIVLALKYLGLEAKYKPVNDVLVKGKKISGSAQVKRRGVILQHGTLIFDADYDMMYMTLKYVRSKGLNLKEKLTTIKGELNGEVTIEEIKEALKRGFERALDMRLIKGKLTKWERSKIEEFVQKYRSRKWIFKVP